MNQTYPSKTRVIRNDVLIYPEGAPIPLTDPAELVAQAVEQGRAAEHALGAVPAAQERCGSAGDDGADLVEGDGPGDVGDAAQLAHDRRHGGGGDQRIGRVQPHAQAQQGKPAEPPRRPDLAPCP